MRKRRRAALSCFAAAALALPPTASAQERPARPSEARPAPASVPGKILYGRICAPCHDSRPGRVGTAALARRLGPGKSVLERRTDLSAGTIEQVVRGGLNAMPPFRPTEISRTELDALIEYLTRKPSPSR